MAMVESLLVPEMVSFRALDGIKAEFGGRCPSGLVSIRASDGTVAEVEAISLRGPVSVEVVSEVEGISPSRPISVGDSDGVATALGVAAAVAGPDRVDFALPLRIAILKVYCAISDIDTVYESEE